MGIVLRLGPRSENAVQLLLFKMVQPTIGEGGGSSIALQDGGTDFRYTAFSSTSGARAGYGNLGLWMR